ncbi:MAG: PQQ-binding-like beta-propeller repeat protein, partial [gamma proteobacterium symbiont of Phacoides pectinatus]
MLVFGGGYDPAQDDTYQLADSYGNSIYVVNAETGALVWEISDSGADLNISSMDNSIPADVKVIDLDEDGYPDRLYAVDVVGRVFRVDFSN